MPEPSGAKLPQISQYCFQRDSLLLRLMKHLPNALTLANLFCGCCAILYILYWQPETAALFSAGSFVFDYLDGMVARALKVSSPLGKELDSLADVVSFGVVPGAMLYQQLAIPVMELSGGDVSAVQWQALPAFILTAFSAFRLGKFNLDTRQTSYFLGLSTPACTVFVLGLSLGVYHNRFDLASMLTNPWFIYGLIGTLSWLLVREIPMVGMKIKRFDWKSNGLNLIFVGVLAILVFVIKELALSAIVVCYMLLSVLQKKKILEG
ncbi:MAG TPA: CDP-diacylglycerol--serine O-phosphatidyltransferase [Saprospirales bacterium]|nr:CDP-diacylglycerol--serine O-phosphatidyltransferase [Saprospirales bacterium]